MKEEMAWSNTQTERPDQKVIEMRLTILVLGRKKVLRKCAQFLETSTPLPSASLIPCGSNRIAGGRYRTDGEWS